MMLVVLSCSFNIDPNLTLRSLLGDDNDVIVPEERVQELSKKRRHKIFNVLVILYYIIHILYYVLCISYYVFYITYYYFAISYYVLTISYYVLDTYSFLFSIGCHSS
jgi:magnesium-transporting ATPase (P-type)